jgi:fatty acid desaturase
VRTRIELLVAASVGLVLWAGRVDVDVWLPFGFAVVGLAIVEFGLWRADHVAVVPMQPRPRSPRAVQEALVSVGVGMAIVLALIVTWEGVLGRDGGSRWLVVGIFIALLVWWTLEDLLKLRSGREAAAR